MSGKTIGLTVAAVLLLILMCGGGGAAFWYFKYGPGAAIPDAGPMPGVALSMPADTALAAGINVKELLASPMYKQFASGDSPKLAEGKSPEDAAKARQAVRDSLEKGLKEADDKTGIRFDRDIDRLALGVWNVGADKPDGALVALGRFDRAKIGRALESALKEGGASKTSKTVAGVEIQVLSEHDKPVAALAFLNDNTLVVGSPAGVETLVTNYGTRARTLEANSSLLGMVKGVDPVSGYWIVVDQALTTRAEKETAGQAPPGMIPRTVTLVGKWDGSLQLAAEMADEQSAKQLVQQAEGGLEFARSQADSNPQAQAMPGLQQALAGVKVASEGKKVTLSIPPLGAALADAAAAAALPSLLHAGPGESDATPSDGMTFEGPDSTGDMQSEAAPPEEEPAAEAPAVETPPRPRATPRPVPRATPRAKVPRPTAQPEEEEEEEDVAPPPPRSRGPVRAGGSVPEPRKIKNVSPYYPALAKKARVQGVVIMECTIDPRGRVSNVRVLRSVPMLDQAAIDAVEQWVYEPTLIDGVPTAVIMTVTVNFKLN